MPEKKNGNGWGLTSIVSTITLVAGLSIGALANAYSMASGYVDIEQYRTDQQRTEHALECIDDKLDALIMMEVDRHGAIPTRN